MIIRQAVPEELQNARGGEGSVTRLMYEQMNQFGGQIKAFAVMDVPPGSSIGLHEHIDDMEVYFMLDGMAEVTDNGEDNYLKAGDILVTVQGETHSLKNKTDQNLTFFALILQ